MTTMMLQLKPQSIKIKEKPYIGLTQENLIEFQVLSVYGLCKTLSNLP